MLRGHATAKIDGKGRLKVPSEFLGTFIGFCRDDRRVFTTSRDGKIALVYPLPVWAEYEQKLIKLPSADPVVERFLRVLNYWGRESAIDASGRVLVHPLLRDHAALNSQVSVFGRQQILELMDHDSMREDAPTIGEEDRATLAERYEV